MQSKMIVAAAVAAVAGSALAEDGIFGRVSFEGLPSLGFNELDPISGVVDEDGTVLNFGVSTTPTGFTPGTTPFVGIVGGQQNFAPGDGSALGAQIGRVYLTDDNTRTIDRDRNYFVEFTPTAGQRLTAVSIDLLDFRADDDAPVGGSVTVFAYGDLTYSAGSIIGSVTFTFTGLEPDPNLFTAAFTTANLDLSVFNGVRALSVIHNSGGDRGTGIDNIAWTSEAVPLPAAAALIPAGLLAVAGYRRIVRR